MKFTSLKMQGFRSYAAPTELTFRPGLNVFQGRNEAGKTGILMAIRAALFVPRSAAEREALIAEGSEQCTVALEYQLPDGGRFQLVRDLANHRGAISQWQDGEWLSLSTTVNDIAQLVRQHTGCDEPLFRASLMVGHEDIEVGDGSDLTRALTERLEVLVSGSPGGISAARAVNKLDAHVKQLSGPRAGLVMGAQARLREAEAALEKCRSDARRLEAAQPRLAELTAAAAALETELDDARQVLARALEVISLGKRAEAIRVERAAIDRALDARSELVELESAAGKARARVPESPALLPASGGAWAIPALAAGVALLVAGLAIAIAVSPIAGGVLALAGLLGAAAGWLGRRRIAAAQPVANPLEAEAREAERRRDIAQGVARSLDQRPEPELVALRASLGRDLQECETALTQASLHRLEPAQLARLEERARRLPGLISEANDARIRCEVELASLEQAGASMVELEDEVAVGEAELDRLRTRLAAMTLARDELEAAVGDIRSGVGPQLAAAAGEALEAIVPDYQVLLENGSGLRFVPAWRDGRPLGRRELSDGTLDQFHFAVRIALADVLLGDLRPPLLLDDPFRYADGERREALHSLLVELAGERQVLYFTVDTPTALAVTHSLPLVDSRALAG